MVSRTATHTMGTAESPNRQEYRLLVTFIMHSLIYIFWFTTAAVNWVNSVADARVHVSTCFDKSTISRSLIWRVVWPRVHRVQLNNYHLQLCAYSVRSLVSQLQTHRVEYTEEGCGGCSARTHESRLINSSWQYLFLQIFQVVIKVKSEMEDTFENFWLQFYLNCPQTLSPNPSNLFSYFIFPFFIWVIFQIHWM